MTIEGCTDVRGLLNGGSLYNMNDVTLPWANSSFQARKWGVREGGGAPGVTQQEQLRHLNKNSSRPLCGVMQGAGTPFSTIPGVERLGKPHL